MISYVKNAVQPSLVSRLVIAQIAVLFLLWVVLVGFVYYYSQSEQEKQDYLLIEQSADFLLQLLSAQSVKTDQLNTTLEKFDQIVNGLATSLAVLDKTNEIKIFVWNRNNLFYKSKGANEGFKSSIQDKVFSSQIDGQNWLVLSKQSLDQKFMVVIMVPESLVSVSASINNRTWLVSPLLASIPLLIIPAWVSVRLALKPLQQLSHVIATREPSNYAPLGFKSKLADLRPLIQSVNVMLEKIQGTRLREQSFIADAAHELRTPIAAIRMNAEALNTHDLAPVDHELLNGLLKSNARAGRLVEQLMALSRSESNTDSQQFKLINLSNIIPDCLAEIAPLARLAQVDLCLNIESNMFLNADEQSIRVLVENVVGNAIKYAPRGSVVIDVSQTAHGALLTVTDEGPGISSERMNRVFDRFYRPSGQSQPGSGLGLAIAKSVAMKHSAHISIHNKVEGSGLVVQVQFPKKTSKGLFWNDVADFSP
jgi:signal transduction histidine kinase